MGLNIGIEATTDRRFENIKALEEEFFEFLRDKFPDASDGFGPGGVYKSKAFLDPAETLRRYDFDVRMFGYGGSFCGNGYSQTDMYLAITEFIYRRWFHEDYLCLEPYWSG